MIELNSESSLRKYFIVLLGTVAVCFSTAFAEEPFKIGVIDPLTGPSASMGVGTQQALLLHPTPHLNFLFENDECSARKAVSSYIKLKAEGVKVFYVGCSGSVLAIAPLAKKDSTLILSSQAGSIAIRKTGDEVIRFNPDGLSVAERMVQYLKSWPPAHYEILNEVQDYAQSVSDEISNALGDAIISKQSYVSNEIDFRTIASTTKQKNPDALILIPVSDQAIRLLYKELEIVKFDRPIIGEVNVCDYPAKPADYGLHGICWKASFTGEAFEKFKQAFREKYHAESQYPFYDAISFDIATILERLVSESGSNVTALQLKASILKGQNGAMATYRFNPKGDVLDLDYLRLMHF